MPTLFGLLVGGSGPARADVILFTDNFNTGVPSTQWGNERGNWAAGGNVYRAGILSTSPPTYTGLNDTNGNDLVLTDFAIDVDVQDLQDGGIWLRSNFNGNKVSGVLLVLGGLSSTGTGLYWHILNDDVYAQGQDFVFGLFTPGVSDPHIRVEVTGNTYSAFVNGSVIPATTLTTAAFASGTVGLYDNDIYEPGVNAHSFDNFVLSVPSPVPEPASLLLLIGAAAGYGWRKRRAAVSRAA